MGKTPLQSNTIKFQIIMAMIGSLVSGIQILKPFMDPEMMAIVILVLTVVNTGGSTYLRFITSSAIR